MADVIRQSMYIYVRLALDTQTVDKWQTRGFIKNAFCQVPLREYLRHETHPRRRTNVPRASTDVFIIGRQYPGYEIAQLILASVVAVFQQRKSLSLWLLTSRGSRTRSLRSQLADNKANCGGVDETSSHFLNLNYVTLERRE